MSIAYCSTTGTDEDEAILVGGDGTGFRALVLPSLVQSRRACFKGLSSCFKAFGAEDETGIDVGAGAGFDSGIENRGFRAFSSVLLTGLLCIAGDTDRSLA